MNITVIGPTYPYKGGISHFTTILVRTLRKTNNVQFLSWKRQYPAFLYPVELKDTNSKNPIKEDANFLLDFYNPISWLQAVFKIKKAQTKLLIFTWVSPVQAPIYFIIGLLYKRMTQTKILFLSHNVLPHEPAFYDKSLAKLAFSQADYFMVHSNEDKKKLEQLTKHKKIILGFHPIYDVFNTGEIYNTEKIKKELGLKKKVLLFFGYIRPYKGLKYLLQAMPDLIKEFPDISLLIAGEFWSKDKKSYLDLIHQLNLKDHLVFIEQYIPNEEVGKYFSVCDIIVLPYTSATQSGIIQIAHAFKKPVISTRVGGLDDIYVGHNVTYTIEKESPADIVEKVKLFYKNLPQNKKLKEPYFSTWDDYAQLLF